MTIRFAAAEETAVRAGPLLGLRKAGSGFHLEGAQAQLDEDASLGARVLGQDGKHHVVHPEERDEQQRGLGESPAGTAQSVSGEGLRLLTHSDLVAHLKWLVSLPPTLGDLSFCTRMRITLMKMRKLT